MCWTPWASPHIGAYEKFRDKYQRLNQKYGKKQFLVPYLMSSHPRVYVAGRRRHGPVDQPDR